MNAKDFRIGNWVIEEVLGNVIISEILEKTVWVTAKNINLQKEVEDVKYHIFIEHITPIPLTNEWLMKFAFKKINTQNIWNVYLGELDEKYRIEETLKKNEYCFRLRTSTNTSYVLKNLKYVHELQNLYFLLTNEELTFKN